MPKLQKQKLNKFSKSQAAFAWLFLLLFILAGEAFAAPRFFDGNKNREIQIPQNQNAQNENSAQLKTVQFFYNTFYYNICFSKENIATLNAAFQNYNSDFENKKLSSKDKKSLKKYGAFSTRLEWGTSRQNMNAFSQNASATLGYAFAKKSPYFVIAIQDAQNQASHKNSAQENESVESAKPNLVLARSGNVYLLFTKSQLGELLKEMEN